MAAENLFFFKIFFTKRDNLKLAADKIELFSWLGRVVKYILTIKTEILK